MGGYDATSGGDATVGSNGGSPAGMPYVGPGDNNQGGLPVPLGSQVQPTMFGQTADGGLASLPGAGYVGPGQDNHGGQWTQGSAPNNGGSATAWWYSNEQQNREAAARANTAASPSSIIGYLNRPGLSTNLGDSITQSILKANPTFTVSQALQQQLIDAKSTSTSIDDRFYQNELDKSLQNNVEIQDAYHHWAYDTNLPQAANPYEYAGDLSLYALKGTQGRDAVFSPVSAGVLNLPAGLGTQDAAWAQAMGIPYDPAQFSPAINAIANAQREGTMGAYGMLGSYSQALGNLNITQQQEIGIAVAKSRGEAYNTGKWDFAGARDYMAGVGAPIPTAGATPMSMVTPSTPINAPIGNTGLFVTPLAGGGVMKVGNGEISPAPASLPGIATTGISFLTQGDGVVANLSKDVFHMLPSGPTAPANSTTVSGGNSTISQLGNWIDTNKNKIDLYDEKQVSGFNKNVSTFNEMSAQNPVITTTKTTVAGQTTSPDENASNWLMGVVGIIPKPIIGAVGVLGRVAYGYAPASEFALPEATAFDLTTISPAAVPMAALIGGIVGTTLFGMGAEQSIKSQQSSSKQTWMGQTGGTEADFSKYTNQMDIESNPELAPNFVQKAQMQPQSMQEAWEGSAPVYVPGAGGLPKIMDVPPSQPFAVPGEGFNQVVNAPGRGFDIIANLPGQGLGIIAKVGVVASGITQPWNGFVNVIQYPKYEITPKDVINPVSGYSLQVAPKVVSEGTAIVADRPIFDLSVDASAKTAVDTRNNVANDYASKVANMNANSNAMPVATPFWWTTPSAASKISDQTYSYVSNPTANTNGWQTVVSSVASGTQSVSSKNIVIPQSSYVTTPSFDVLTGQQRIPNPPKQDLKLNLLLPNLGGQGGGGGSSGERKPMNFSRFTERFHPGEGIGSLDFSSGRSIAPRKQAPQRQPARPVARSTPVSALVSRSSGKQAQKRRKRL